jgi:hypothetical protein
MLIPEVWQIDGSMTCRKFPYLVKARRIYQFKEYIFYKEILKKFLENCYHVLRREKNCVTNQE